MQGHLGYRGEFRVTGLWRDRDRLEDLRRIGVPTPVLVGRYDLLSVDTALEMGRRIPHARVVVFETSGHVLYPDEPEKFLSEVRASLRTRVRPRG